MGLATALTIAGGALAATQIAKKPKIPAPPVVKPTPPPPEVEKEGAEQFARRRQGRSSTLLTGSLESGTTKQSLLGS